MPAKMISASVSDIRAPAIKTYATLVFRSLRSTRMRLFVASDVTPMAMATKRAAIRDSPYQTIIRYPSVNGTKNPPSAARSLLLSSAKVFEVNFNTNVKPSAV